MAVEFLALGPLEVRHAGQAIAINGMRQQKLLALLLLNVNSTVSVDWLVDELWEAPPKSVRQQIHNAVAGVRRTLSGYPGLQISTSPAGYLLEAERSAIDLHVFSDRVKNVERIDPMGCLDNSVAELREALALWRGRVLLGITSPAIDAIATSMEERRLVARERLAALRLASGEFATVVGELREMVSQYPLRESLRYNLMLALYKAGWQADALEVFDHARRELAEELGVDPGPQLRALHADILQGARDIGVLVNGEIRTLEAPGTHSSALAAERPAQCYLPNDTRDFFGRSDELTDLLADIEVSSPTALSISAIGGMGGVGKTALAVHLAHRVLADYPDGQFFIDLHGFTLGVEPLTPAEALDSLLRDSGVAGELVPPALEGRVARWRAHMAGKRAIVVLDNAVNVEQVRPLLPGTAGILVVITSRRKLAALEGMTSIDLDVLPHSDAIEVFRLVAGKRRTEAEAEAISNVVRLCGRLPLALRIAGSRFRERPAWTVADLVIRLEGQARRGKFLEVEGCSVADVLRVSYRYLRPLGKRVFRMLGLHPGADFDKYAAAALAGISAEEAEETLEALLDDNLVRQDVPGRYYFHDLVRDCAHELCVDVDSREDRDLAQRALLDYYVHAAFAHCEPLSRIELGMPQAERPAFWTDAEVQASTSAGGFEYEFGNIVSSAQFAAERNWHRTAWQLACMVQPYLRSRNYDGNSRKLCELGVASARSDGSELAESICLQGLAAVHRERGSTAEAHQHLNRALRLSRASGDEAVHMEQLTNLGALFSNEDRLQASLDAYLAAEEKAAQLKNIDMLRTIRNNLGVACRDLGRFDEALDYLHAALELERSRTNSIRGTAVPLWNIASIAHFRREHHKADELFSRVYEDSVRGGFSHGEALGLVGMSATRRSLGKVEDSIDFGRQALALARRFAFRRVECEALSTIGEAWFSSGATASSSEVFDQAMSYSREYSFSRFIARAFEGFAHIAYARGDMATAERHWRDALDTYPANMHERAYARFHLDSLGRAEAGDCFRCGFHYDAA
ncbi:AfsR/SARP family transcriptional regulator [Amycolatopsis rubida]|uniref:DNA-binding transcriptional activator of the SARP family n=1 Tax=Amycolatopsis rubida TaxID=112413 RepID=A0A1I5ZBL4_9PSEU|nr:BTAD domain-containing putative transcriptional regulator [Amycolatopsis rubida]SFQ53830.1 DNA-binding transcriptional activator of the SARP family [Amycolatopsis rubida]